MSTSRGPIQSTIQINNLNSSFYLEMADDNDNNKKEDIDLMLEDREYIWNSPRCIDPKYFQFFTVLKERIEEHIDKKAPSSEFKILDTEQNETIYLTEEFKEAKKDINLCKNRYTAIVPFEKNRVKLAKKNGIEGSDYINASFINGEYIAAQAPTQATINDFWRMVYEQKTNTIVMLTKEFEGSTIKAQRYWPDTEERMRKDYGGIIVTLRVEDPCEGFIVREFKLQSVEAPTEEPHTIFQFHYYAWPDHGIPDETWPVSCILQAVHLIRRCTKVHDLLLPSAPANTANPCKICNQPKCNSTGKEVNIKPIVVHCSAGVGRSGTFLIIYHTLKKLREACYAASNAKEIDISLINLLREFRSQRYGMVPKKSQYKFCYTALLDELKMLCGEVEPPAD